MTPDSASIQKLRRSVDEGLFPPPAAGRSPFTRGQVGVLLAAFLVLGTVLSLLRLGTDAFETIWAEDGPIYLQSAVWNGFWHATFEPYAGYLVVGPRLIAEVAALFPLQDAAAVISIVSALVASLSGVAVWYGSAGHLRDPYLRGALAIGTVLAAAAGQETIDSAAYAPWFMLFGTFWLLFLRPRSWWGAGLAGAFIVLTGLSTPGVWFFLPVVVLRAFCSWRDRRALVLLGSWAVGAFVQIPVVLGQEQGSPLWSRHIWTALVQRVIDSGIFGQRLGGNLWEHLGWGFLVVLCVVLAIGLFLGLRRAPASSRWFVAIAIPTSFVMFIVSVYQRTVGPNIFWSPGGSGGTASRYVLVPALLFLAALLVTLDGVLRRRDGSGAAARSWRPHRAAAVAVLVVLVAIAVSFDMRSSARGAPYWGDALRTAADKCIDKGEEVAGIATSPAPFGMQVACTEVESFAAPALRERHR